MEKVFLRRQRDYDPAGVRAAVRDIIEASGVDPKGKSVFLKPSFVYPNHDPATIGVVTQPPFIGGVVQALNDLGASRVMVGEDSTLGPSRSAFYAMGIFPYIKGIATPVYFDEERHIRVDVPSPVVQGSFVVPAVWKEADLFVSLPKIKVNMFADVTLSVKNNLGFLRQKHRVRNHTDRTLHGKIADLYRVRPPDLVIADSIVAGEGQGPMLASPVELGVIAGGANGVAVDAVACRLMGVDPDSVEHLRHLRDAGIGPLSDGEIEVVGESVEDIARPFVRSSAELVGLNENIRVFEGQERCCAYGCKGMVRNSLDAWLAKPGQRKELNIIVGKGVDLPSDVDPRRTLVVGDCAAEHSGRGWYLPGCPVMPMHTFFRLLRYFGGTLPIYAKYGDYVKGYVAGYGWKAARYFKGLTGPPVPRSWIR